VALATGTAEPDARRFTVKATLGSSTAGIVSAPFLQENFRKLSHTFTLSLEAPGLLYYEQDTVLQIFGRTEPFHHTDSNTLKRVAAPTPNPAVLAEPSTG
jgi:hypothetical protein